MPSRALLLVKFPRHLRSTHVHVAFCFSWEFGLMSVTKKGYEERVFSNEKSPNCSTILVINFSINWIYLESTCLHYPQMPRKMTKFVLNDLFEEIKLFLERASSSNQIKSSMYFSLQFYIQVVEVLHYVSQIFNSFPFFITS